jgi:hypothetical protein
MSDVVQHNKDRYVAYPPAEQHQGEPVALPAAMHPHDFDNLPEAHCDGWNACLDEIAKLGPLYTHADPGEVERLRASLEVATHNVNEMQDQFEACKAENDTLRAQLAERDELLGGHVFPRPVCADVRQPRVDGAVVGVRGDPTDSFGHKSN